MLSRLAAASLLLALTACGGGGLSDQGDIDAVDAPELHACRALTPADLGQPQNATEVVDCTEKHTAETFAVGEFPARVADRAEDVDDPVLGAYVFKTCSQRFQTFVDGDESTVLRSMLSWAWFRPSQTAWEDGARWYRCDVVAGTEASKELPALPKTTEHLLLEGPDDDWMTCGVGETVAESEKVPCSEPHNWRAVTTIQVGREEDPYPGDRLVEIRTRDFCSDSVGAWMGYPVDYDFGYTYFHKAEWEAGNRRSICWAKTDK